MQNADAEMAGNNATDRSKWRRTEMRSDGDGAEKSVLQLAREMPEMFARMVYLWAICLSNVHVKRGTSLDLSKVYPALQEKLHTGSIQSHGNPAFV